MKSLMHELIKRRSNGEKVGIYSACSANEIVIETVMEAAAKFGIPALIEATANQCNQFGGYSGMKPADFARYVNNIAERINFDKSQLILGGDHLGPLVWQNESESLAMEKAEELVRQYVGAGFEKIHIDTSMMLSDDDHRTKLSDDIIARRAARLVKIAEEAFAERQKHVRYAIAPVYIIGSEVPIPGGSKEDEEQLIITSPEQFIRTYETFKSAFEEWEIADAFLRVIGIVVQPGVEFGDTQIIRYNRALAGALTSTLKNYHNIVFEGHSTDYQSRQSLREMVEDGIAILKVGPALTFAFREALFALANMEDELLEQGKSNFKSVLLNAMQKNPDNWIKHYHGTENEILFKMKYSFSDRCRYYLPDKDVSEAIEKLKKNINEIQIPLSILSQYMPDVFRKVIEEGLEVTAELMIKSRIMNCIESYILSTIIKCEGEKIC